MGADISDTVRHEAVGASCLLPRYRAAIIAVVDDDLRRLTDTVPSPVAYPPEAIPAGGLDGGFVFVDGHRCVPAYSPITQAEDAVPLAAEAPPPVATPAHELFFFASKFQLFATEFHVFATPPSIFATPPYFFAAALCSLKANNLM